MLSSTFSPILPYISKDLTCLIRATVDHNPRVDKDVSPSNFREDTFGRSLNPKRTLRLETLRVLLIPKLNVALKEAYEMVLYKKLRSRFPEEFVQDADCGLG
jgi:hypothetical protein